MKTDMNKTFKYLFLQTVVVLAVLGLSSCMWGGDHGGSGGGDEEFKTGYFSFRFDAGKVGGTRAGDEEPGTDRERHIDRIYLLLYNTDGDLKYAWDLEATNVGGSGLLGFTGDDVAADKGPQPGSFVTIAREVSYEQYYLVVIANPGQYADAAIFGRNPDADDPGLVIGTDPALASSIYRNLSALQAAVSGVGPDSFGYLYAGGDDDGNKFFMSNANGPAPVPVSYIKASKAEAEDDPAPVAIERALAKVEVSGGADVKVYDTTGSTVIGEVKEFNWVLCNWNRDTYLIRRFGNIGNHCPEAAYAGLQETYENGLHVGKKYLYATDPNMGTTGDFGGEAETPADLASVNGRPWNSDGDPEYHYMYSTENTMDTGSQGSPDLYSFATHVWARVNLKIYEFENAKGFWSFDISDTSTPEWVMCSWAQARDWWDNDAFPHNMAKLKGFLQAMQAQPDGGVMNPLFDMGVAAEPELTEPAEVAQGDPGYDDYLREHALYVEAHFKPVAVTAAGLKVYYHLDGICNYRIPVKHFCQNSESTGDYGYYGVVRNNAYKINITKVIGPGVTAAKTGHIAADITVNEWYVRSQSNGGLDPYYPE